MYDGVSKLGIIEVLSISCCGQAGVEWWGCSLKPGTPFKCRANSSPNVWKIVRTEHKRAWSTPRSLSRLFSIFWGWEMGEEIA